jgi:hypothetical protein
MVAPGRSVAAAEKHRDQSLLPTLMLNTRAPVDPIT